MDINKLVKSYKKTRNQQDKAQLIEELSPLVHSLAKKINAPSNVLASHEDLYSIGIEGLLSSLENYDATKDVQFKTFAYYRIRGNMIDYLRSIDELSRSKRSAFSESKSVTCKLQQSLGRNPSNQEVASALHLTLHEYDNLIMTAKIRAPYSLDISFSDFGGDTFASQLENDIYNQPDSHMIDEESKAILESTIKKLPERNQLILALYYYESYTLREIGSSLKLSEARISQIISASIKMLRGSIQYKLSA